MASDHRAHANAPRAYTRVHLHGRDNEASVGVGVGPVVRAGRGGEGLLAHYKRYERRTRDAGGTVQRMRGSEKDSTPIVGHRRRSKGSAGGIKGRGRGRGGETGEAPGR